MKLEAKSVVRRIITGIVTIIISAAFSSRVFLPTWNFQSVGFWWYWIIVGIVAIIAFLIVDHITYDKPKSITETLGIILLITFVINTIIGCVLSSRLFNADKYSNLIEIEEEIQSISTVEEAKNFLLLDVQTAQKLGNRSLSEINNEELVGIVSKIEIH